jgi:hypothetical protein
MRSTVQVIEGSGILLLAGVMFIGIAGCGGFGTPPYVTPSTLNAVSMNAADWNILWGTGMPLHPAAFQTGWQFDMPTGSGSVHYVEVPYKATENLTGKTLTVTFSMVSNEPIYNANVEAGESGPPSFHLFLERLNDDFTNEYYRWWCSSGGYNLGTQDNQTITLSCPLTSTAWTSVYGVSTPGPFADALNNLGWVGMTFGGSGQWGHGVRLLGGSAQFQVLDVSIK